MTLSVNANATLRSMFCKTEKNFPPSSSSTDEPRGKKSNDELTFENSPNKFSTGIMKNVTKNAYYDISADLLIIGI